MKDVHFYEEIGFQTAIALDTTRLLTSLPMISPVADPPLVWCRYGWSAPLVKDRALITYHAIPIEYLRSRAHCLRISERRARELHPELFAHPRLGRREDGQD